MHAKLINSDKSTDYPILNAIIAFVKYNNIFKNLRVNSKTLYQLPANAIKGCWMRKKEKQTVKTGLLKELKS